ncbi:hypothetical protein ACMZ8K_05350 [Gardnerella swidsinskii]|uniref:hypothetical protein n=1 Tax=Gardnerella swidsinskii TaxID=2792979 RepID=UPI00059ADB4D
MKQIENGDTNMFAKKGFAIVALAAIVYAVPMSAYAQMSGSVVGIDRESIPCAASVHNNQAKLVCHHSPKFVRARIACRFWPDQLTNWIKDGVEYSGGCIFGVNDTPSGNPVTMEVGSN